MRVKLIATARAKTKRVEKDLLLARADLHESNSDLATAIDGVQKPSRESVAAAVEQNAGVQVQLNDAMQELATVSELLRVAEAKIDEGSEQASSAASRQPAGAVDPKLSP
jgi:hypothetical protein